MPHFANNPAKKSWLEVSKDSDFPIQNIPFGVFITKDDVITIGTRIGDSAIDMGALQQLGYFEGIELTDDMFMQDTLNDFISDGKKTWRQVRNRLSDLFDENNPKLALRTFVQGGGCSGFSYGFTFDDEKNEDDFEFPINEQYNVLVDAMSMQYLQGAKIDYKEELMGSQFVISNPNAQSTCGCGSSFSV